MKGNGLPLVSVILGAYNALEFIPDALQSILSQDYPHLELIVIDDASRDGTWDYLTSFRDPRLRIFRNRKNLGIPATRNRGLRVAKGAYLTFFDHDDLMLPGAIRKRVEFLEKERKAEAVFGYTKAVIGRNGKVSKDISNIFGLKMGHVAFFLALKVLHFEDVRRFMVVHHLLLQNFMFRRSLLRRAGFFDIQFETADDSDYRLRLAKLTPFHFVNVPVRFYRFHGMNKSMVTPTKRIIKEWRVLIRRYGIDSAVLGSFKNLETWQRKYISKLAV